MRRKRIKGASIAAVGSHSPKFQTENHKPESSKSKNNQKHSTLHSATVLTFKQTHGVSLPKTLTGTPYGNPQGLSLPKERSANLYGVAHPLGGGVSFTTDNLNQGESHE